MAEDQEKGVDELISDALVAYAQLAGYQTGVTTTTTTGRRRRRPARAPPTRPRPRRRRRCPRRRRGAGVRAARPGPGWASSRRRRRRRRRAPAPVPDAGSAGPPPLYLVFDNQKYRIDKDQFIIGRGSKSSDLPIKDGNISRKHAAVIRRNGTYFIKDLGSTNGIDFKGMRIDNKRIDEGDLFHLCDYELRFTYKR